MDLHKVACWDSWNIAFFFIYFDLFLYMGIDFFCFISFLFILPLNESITPEWGFLVWSAKNNVLNLKLRALTRLSFGYLRGEVMAGRRNCLNWGNVWKKLTEIGNKPFEMKHFLFWIFLVKIFWKITGFA